ncbi:MAG TPA: copper chaperone PCu(A)C [Novosphingobium sp.]|nr:copper chaperone PCu(A)C [Novosphingobium sp.]
MNRFSRLLALSTLAMLGACGKNSPDVAQTETATAAPETKPGLALSGGKLVLPAVKGNPAAAYFTLANGSGKPVSIAAIEVAGAGMAMMHETKQVAGHSEMVMLDNPTIAPGASLVFARGGKHVMVMDPPADLKPGETVELTLTFSDGDKLSAPLGIVGPAGE